MSKQPLSATLEILLVEDNPGDARLVEEAFTSATVETNFQTVTDGEDALSALERCRSNGDDGPDLVLLDLNLPRVSGFDVLERLRDGTTSSTVPVLVLTSSDAEEDVLRSYRLAANAYLTKPTGPAEYESLVEAVEDFWVERARLPPGPS